MPIEAATPLLLKSLISILSPLASGAISVFKSGKEKIDAEIAAKDLEKSITNINTVKTMWSRDEGILLDSFYHPPKLIKKTSNTPIISTLEITTGASLIEGIVGQGKSIFLRHLCSSFLDQGKVPVFIELRMTSSKRSLESLIINFLEESGINGTPEVLAHLIKINKIALILDGFDEISPDLIQDIVYEIEHLKKKHDQLSIVISSRPHHAAHSLANFKTYSLAELTAKDHELFLLKLIENPAKRFEITEAISGATDNIKGVITTPLMLTLLVLVYESDKEIPATLPEFFDRLFGTVFTRHDKLKAGFERKHFSNLPESKIQKLFDAFCFMHMQSEGTRSVSRTQFNSSFERALKYTYDIRCELEDFKKDITNVACLMLEEGLDQLSFLHKSIMEYHAASFIRSSSEEFAIRFYKSVSENFPKWEPILQFLRSIDSFRYGRFYILEEYPSQLQDLSNALKDQSNKSLIAYIEKKIPGLLLLTTNFRISGINSNHPKSSEIEIKIIQGIVESLLRQTHESNNPAIQKAIRATPQTKRKSNQLSMNTKSIVENFRTNEIWMTLQEIKEYIEQEIMKYSEIVEIELEKSSIFD